jgi:ABC-2 type transport system ATP-binding protein
LRANQDTGALPAPGRPAGTDAALEVSALSKSYRSRHALAGVDLQVAPGELVGLLGPNGAGKSTLTKVACGLVTPTSGGARVCGWPAGSAPARRSLGYLAETFRFPGWATATELLELHQRLVGSADGTGERAQALDAVGLADAKDVRVEAMSKGMQQRLGIAQAMLGSPRLLLLDEPTSALDPAGRRVVRDLLQGQRSRGTAVLLNSHLLSEVELVCDRVVILSGGRVVTEGRPSDLTRPRGVEVQTAKGVRRFDAASREDAPRIVAELIAAGEAIYGVQVLTSTLEEVYLDAVGDAGR